MVTPNEKAKSIIKSINYVTVATADKEGNPWNTPVAAFRFEDSYDFYWASWTDNQHSKNIRETGKAFIVIFDSTPEDKSPQTGVYIQAEAFELNDEKEVMKAAFVFQNDEYNLPDGKLYIGSRPRRIYKAVPQKFWTNNDGDIRGDFVDTRVEAQE